jgi:hypothetical protein
MHIAQVMTSQIALKDPELLRYVESAASGRPVRALYLEALLQLPRLADVFGHVPIVAVEKLLPELAEELPPGPEWVVHDAGRSPRFLTFGRVDADAANDVMLRFHYLHSPRTDGRAYGLRTYSGRLVAVCVSSPLDVKLMRDLLAKAGRSARSPRVLSRVFAFVGAPNNTISYVLSRVAREERSERVTDLLTYVNPNMTFTGSSYLASGWQQIGTEPGTKYRYLDNRYITDRQLQARFGALDDPAYYRLLGSRFATSLMPLAPLIIFHTPLD